MLTVSGAGPGLEAAAVFDLRQVAALLRHIPQVRPRPRSLAARPRTASPAAGMKETLHA